MNYYSWVRPTQIKSATLVEHGVQVTKTVYCNRVTASGIEGIMEDQQGFYYWWDTLVQIELHDGTVLQ